MSDYRSPLPACDLVYLGSVDVSSAGSDALLAQTVQQFKSLELSSMNIVTFKASRDGITLTDNVNGWVDLMLYCGSDYSTTNPIIIGYRKTSNCVTCPVVWDSQEYRLYTLLNGRQALGGTGWGAIITAAVKQNTLGGRGGGAIITVECLTWTTGHYFAWATAVNLVHV